jgi:hypothetical protein
MIGIGKNLFKSNVKVVGGASTDPDAQAFITAAGITDATQKSAVNQLVLDLKGYSIWTKMKAIYPIVGGSASSHKWNLKDPRDLDAAYRLNFATGWTHSINGMTPNGTSAYADTFITPSTSLNQNNTHLSIYSRTDLNSGGASIGSNMGTPLFTNQLAIVSKSANIFYSSINQASVSGISNTNGRGFYLAKRTSSTGIVMQKNNTQTSVTISSSGLSNFKLSIGATNAGGSFYYDPNQLAFVSIGDGLTDTEATNFYTAVQNYNTTLGRQV